MTPKARFKSRSNRCRCLGPRGPIRAVPAAAPSSGEGLGYLVPQVEPPGMSVTQRKAAGQLQWKPGDRDSQEGPARWAHRGHRPPTPLPAAFVKELGGWGGRGCLQAPAPPRVHAPHLSENKSLKIRDTCSEDEDTWLQSEGPHGRGGAAGTWVTSHRGRPQPAQGSAGSPTVAPLPPPHWLSRAASP